MNNLAAWSLLISSLFILSSNCSSGINKLNNNNQNLTDVDTLKNRKAVFAGSFYPGSKSALQSTLNDLFANAKKPIVDNPVAIICPHAGYIYSGQVAASSYNQITNPLKYDRVFILASSHRVSFQGASIFNMGNYETPLGEIKVDFETARTLMDKNKYFTYYPAAHSEEHSLEVQLPFLQHVFGDHLLIVPIILGTQNKDVCKSLAETLKPYFNGKNLFVISSDFSHYPSYDDAVSNDSFTAEAICLNEPDKLLSTLKNNESSGTPGLLTSLCGWTSVLTLEYMTSELKNITYQKVAYSNSGDVSYGDKNRVVGYTAIAVGYHNNEYPEEFQLSEDDKENLLKIARETLEHYLSESEIPKIDERNLSPTLLSNSGAFVTLNKNHVLRGCIGRFITDKPLYKTVQDMAIAAALHDSRFPNVVNKELKEIEIEISVLSPLKKISSIDDFELGKHGIYIKSGFRTGTFLPQVADDTNWNKIEFISHCAHDKAGIGWDGWKEKNVELFIYTATVFFEEK